jgi:hypothetical protein
MKIPRKILHDFGCGIDSRMRVRILPPDPNDPYKPFYELVELKLAEDNGEIGRF